MSKKVSPEALFKALDDLEEKLTKGETPTELPKTTKQANGGLAAQAGGEGEEADVDAGSDGEDPTDKALDGDEIDLSKADDDETSDEESEESEEEASKSLRQELDENEDVAKGLEVSSFLEGLVDTVSGGVDRLNKSFEKNFGFQNDFNLRMSKALIAMGNQLVEMQAKLDAVAESPVSAGPKSVVAKALTARAVQATSGGLQGEGVVERFEGEDAPEFSKSQALDALVGLAQEGKIHPALVAQYETTGSLPGEVVSLVEAKLRRA